MQIELWQELMERKEDLCPELERYYSEGYMFPSVRHPLLYSVPHSPQQNAMCNHRIKLLLQEREDKIVAEDWEGYVWMHEKPYRLEAFCDIMRKLKSKQYWEILGEVWINSENIWQNKQRWFKLLSSKAFDRQYFMSKEDAKFLEKLPNTVTVYRGFVPEQNHDGFSYTLSKNKAIWFSNRFNKKGKVLTRTVKREEIFAYMSGRGEQEVIILPKSIN